MYALKRTSYQCTLRRTVSCMLRRGVYVSGLGLVQGTSAPLERPGEVVSLITVEAVSSAEPDVRNRKGTGAITDHTLVAWSRRSHRFVATLEELNVKTRGANGSRLTCKS